MVNRCLRSRNHVRKSVFSNSSISPSSLNLSSSYFLCDTSKYLGTQWYCLYRSFVLFTVDGMSPNISETAHGRLGGRAMSYLLCRSVHVRYYAELRLKSYTRHAVSFWGTQSFDDPCLFTRWNYTRGLAGH